MSYRKVDLNLLALFDTLMRLRSVAAASREMGVTASAVSHGLARLRKLLGDELFIARTTGMEPTARALQLAPDIRAGLGALTSALEERCFDPATSARTFAIAATDYSGGVLLPHLVRRVALAAPAVHLKVFPLGRLDVVEQLNSGRLNLLIGWFDDTPGCIRRQTLLMEHEAIVVRNGHPLTDGPVTKARILAFSHVVVEVTGSEHQGADGFIDDHGVFRRIWIERLLIEAEQSGAVGWIGVTVPHYADVPPILRNTDMVATLPRRMALRAALRDGLTVLELPYQASAVPLEMIWHERANQDPGMEWLLGQLEAAGRDAEAD